MGWRRGLIRVSPVNSSMQLLDLEGSVPRQSLDWLVELGGRLNVVIEVVDVYDAPVCPVGPTRDAAAVRTMLSSGDLSLRAAMSAAIRSKTPVPVAVESLQFVCFRLAAGGVLLLARTLSPDDSTEECLEDLESIGPWLTGAIDASLAQPNAVSAEGYRIVSFRRILREAASRGSLRNVAGAFIEALSVWDDVRVRAYVAGASGGFFEYASSMTGHTSSSAEGLDDTIVPRHGQMVRLSRADVDRAGLLVDPGDTLITRMAIGAGTVWVLVFSGMINDAVHVRLRVYTDILRESLNDVLTTITSRIVAELSRRHIPQNEPVSTAAQAALGQLTAAVGARQAALVVTTTTGRQALAVGNADLLTALDRARGTRLLIRSSDAGGVMTVVVERDHTAFTAFEREIAQAAVAAMQPWIEAALPRSNDVERRGSARPVDIVFDQLATDAVAAGQHATMIVMAVESGMVSPGLLPSWVARIRARLRAGDRAGILSDREIAVLLYGASADQAALVSSRLEQLLESRSGTQGFAPPAIGMTTRMPDSPFEGSLVAAARASATLRS
jgi:outer membrane lipoprotein SlyB